jgi:hypothetical protein
MTSPFLERPKADWIASNELAFAIHDSYPVSPGHALVVPRRVIATWFEAQPPGGEVMPIPEPEDQVQFLFKVQRLLSEGSFVATDKYALLLSLADLAVERGDDASEDLSLDALDPAHLTRRVAGWAYGQAERAGSLVWSHGRAGMVALDARWRSLLAAQ